MAHEVIGKLHKLFETQQVTDRFNKREFVLQRRQGEVRYFNSLEVSKLERAGGTAEGGAGEGGPREGGGREGGAVTYEAPDDSEVPF